MSLLLRIDVDRPYGKSPLGRHVLSRLSSDAYLPRLGAFGYLRELEEMLQFLNNNQARAYVFFRRCTLPSGTIMSLLEQGGHEIGLHLEDSRSWTSFEREKQHLEQHIGKAVRAVSKHGSGGNKYGLRHYAPYEPEKYVEWAQRSDMSLFLGNLEDPTLKPVAHNERLVFYPSAFWLEPYWRDTDRFSVEWLLEQAKRSDLVMLVHPENILGNPSLTAEFRRIISTLGTEVLCA